MHALILQCLIVLGPSWPAPADVPRYDLSKDKVLYCVGYAHLDTQWRWDFSTTIDRYIAATLDDNFARFEKYPGYVFNFTGSVRYEMMKEYYPEKYEQLKRYIADGRWFVSGSSVDEGDVNVPSAESIVRQVLYGNNYFRKEFGKESVDFMLPDCFGFPASMPSIWAHCGLKGFSTQKLTWGSAVGIPFKIGVWEGLDGRGVVAALDPGPYTGGIDGRVDLNADWIARIHANGEQYGVWADYHYYGVGDQGGAPREQDIANYLDSMGHPDSQITVALVSSDQMYKDLTPEQVASLPRYRGDMLLTEHSAGTLTSQSYMKRWNRKNEQLADAAERAAVMADWLGGAPYPQDKLNRAWVRTLANQMHDILPGTSLPRAYEYSWNDEIVALNGFAAVLEDSVGGVAQGLHTATRGIPLVVYNALATEREDVVEATVRYDGDVPEHIRVYDPFGRPVATQVLERLDHALRILFLARVPSVSLSVFDVRSATQPPPDPGLLTVSERAIENAHYRVTLDDAGDVASIIDRTAGDRELLSRPAQLEFTYEKPQAWPAWNMDWADRQRPLLGVVDGPPRVRIVEHGPVRSAIEITRTARNSVITQVIRLAAGDAGSRVEFATHIDWQSAECALRAAFPLTVSNPKATYNWEMGTIQRANNEPTKYEVPSHQWFDLTNHTGDYGVSILEDSKYGSDKPADDVMRLTLLFTPGVRGGYMDQHSQDWGRHDILYGLYGHAGDWRAGRSEWQARRLNQPLTAFQTTQHTGALGPQLSFVVLNSPQVDLRAMKRAENDDCVILRLQELWGQPADGIEVALATQIVEAWEVDGQERRIDRAKVVGGRLRTALSPHSPRSFAVRFSDRPVTVPAPECTTIELPFNADVVSRDTDRSAGAMDVDGRSLPAEMLPAQVTSESIVFELGSTFAGHLQAVRCRGQQIDLPTGYERLYVLAAATEDCVGRFRLGDQIETRAIQRWTGFVGQFDNRVWDRPFAEVDFSCRGKVVSFDTGYIKRDNIAWFSTHRHHPTAGNEAYKFSYLFKYAFDIPAGTTTLELPDDERIIVMAASAGRQTHDDVHAAAPLYDDFTGRAPIALRHAYPPPIFEGMKQVGTVEIDRQPTFGQLSMGPPTTTDDIDSSGAHGIVFKYDDLAGTCTPHPRSGAVDGRLPRLTDGAVAAHDDDLNNVVFFDSAGRFFVDLQRSTPLDAVHTYSWHRANRAPQYFSLWGANGDTIPDTTFDRLAESPWQLIAVVDSRDLGDGQPHGSRITAPSGRLGPYRYLLWIAEDMGEGTFFTEIDVHAAN